MEEGTAIEIERMIPAKAIVLPLAKDDEEATSHAMNDGRDWREGTAMEQGHNSGGRWWNEDGDATRSPTRQR